MEDVRRAAFYTAYPEKPVSEQDDMLGTYGIVSLVFGLMAVMFGVRFVRVL